MTTNNTTNMASGNKKIANKRQALPIWCDANQLLVQVETAVRQFARYHKYSIDQDLRQQARRISRIISHTLRAHKQQRLRALQKLILAIDDFKVLLQLGKEIKAFHNFTIFQDMVELAVSPSKQSDAWLRHQQKNAQPEGYRGE